ncbi:hypothetical protein RFI_11550, partial [Reticulomyxa filosa]
MIQDKEQQVSFELILPQIFESAEFKTKPKKKKKWDKQQFEDDVRTARESQKDSLKRLRALTANIQNIEPEQMVVVCFFLCSGDESAGTRRMSSASEDWKKRRMQKKAERSQRATLGKVQINTNLTSTNLTDRSHGRMKSVTLDATKDDMFHIDETTEYEISEKERQQRQRAEANRALASASASAIDRDIRTDTDNDTENEVETPYEIVSRRRGTTTPATMANAKGVDISILPEDMAADDTPTTAVATATAAM